MTKKAFSQVLYLVSWPSLDSLLQENVLPATRICALLARRPSVGAFIPVVLDISPDIVYPLLEMLYAKGHIYQNISLPADHATLSKNNLLQEDRLFPEESAMMAYEAPEDFGKRTPNRLSDKTDVSFFEHLWKRLTESDRLGQTKLV